MPKHDPWHSVKESVHHDNTNCNAGASVAPKDLRSGTGGKPLCPECERLGAAGR